MKTLRTLLPLPALLLLLTGAAKAPDMTVRFYAEANEHDGERFMQPLQLKYPPRTAFIEKAPVISERNITGIYIFEAANGTNGCLFRLDDDGRIRLNTASLEKRGTSLVAFVGTKHGSHQVIDMVVDKPVTDGMISIQQGLTPMEVQQLEKEFKPIIPQTKKK